MNTLYFGDSLDVLKELNKQHPGGFIDLIYIDPPFNSKRNYNVLFEEVDLKDTKAQKQAFADTWSNVSYKDTLHELQTLDLDLYKFLTALDAIRLSKGAIAYLTTMAIRILYMRKVLKDTGSFYLHCDQTMSHYLKILCDLVFGEQNFKNEIIWKRTSAHNDSGKYGINVDSILFYSKSKNNIWNQQYILHKDEYLKRFKQSDPDGRKWQDGPLTAKGLSGGGYNYEYKGINGFWRCPLETMKKLDKENRLYYTKNGGIRIKRYLDENKGYPIQTLIDDVFPINSQAQERLGYPTQKPEALLERIIKASSNEGDLVADFFCGCGTTIAVAQRLNRQWLGADISHLAIRLILDRLTKPYGEEERKRIRENIEVNGFPKDVASARELATKTDKHRVKFQDWVIEVMLGGVSNEKKTADGGYDGYLIYPLSGDGKKKGTAIIEVKSGIVGISVLRSFANVVNSEKADMGIFVCFDYQVTDGMRKLARDVGYIPDFKVDRLQIITVEDLLDGKTVRLPGLGEMLTFKSATKRLDKENGEEELF
ncbi:MAG: site-specific DNA-methyltransferase [Bacteroidetes bacterium]|nr:MAG: site-specific DNA-methyltransferase [Bacteroidota bacterium]